MLCVSTSVLVVLYMYALGRLILRLFKVTQQQFFLTRGLKEAAAKFNYVKNIRCRSLCFLALDIKRVRTWDELHCEA